MSGDLFTPHEEPANELESDVDALNLTSPELPSVRDSLGRRTAFDEGRLRASIERAQKDAGEKVSTLADEVADIVRFTLASKLQRTLGADDQSGPIHLATPLEADEIGALVERALIEVGATGTARSYIVARDRRLRARDLGRGPGRGPVDAATLGQDSGQDSGVDPSGALAEYERGRTLTPAAGSKLPSVRGASGAESFRARRIVAALIEEAGLLPSQAEDVASGVQSIVARAGMRVVSTGLIRELVNSQLLARGLDEALHRHESVGLPRHDLSRLFQDATPESVEGVGGTRRFETGVSKALLGRWFLDDALPPAIAEAHRTGDLFVGGLEALHRVRIRSIPAALLLKGKGDSGFAALERVGRLARDASEGLLIEDLGTLRKSVGDQDSVRAFVLALGGLAQASARRIDLSATGGEDAADALKDFLMGMAKAWADGATLPRVFATLEGVAKAVAGGAGDAAEMLLWSGHLVPVWTRSAGSWSALDRAASDRGSMAIGASVSINLARLARRAGPWREDVFLAAASEAVEFGVDALQGIAEFQETARSQQGVAVSDRVSYTLHPVGLVDALRILGDGIARADQGSRILGFLGEAVQRLGSSRGLDVRLVVGCTTSDGEAAGKWFATCDAKQGGPGQPRLFSDLPRPEEERPRAYGSGVGELTAMGDPKRVRERAEAIGSLLCTVPSGALVPEAMVRHGAAAEAAEVADFLEILARAKRAIPAGEPESVDPKAREKSRKGPENPTSEEVQSLLNNRARWPRLGAWARFAEVRSATTLPLSSIAETTLF